MGWTNEWRIKGIPENTRYSSPEEAIRAARRVRRMIPDRPKGKKENGGRRPNFITAERMHHSRGKKWEEFLEVMGFQHLSKYEQCLLMDGFKLGGTGLFAAWKQREYEAWIPIKKVKFMDYGDRQVILVQMEDGTIVERPFIDEEAERKKLEHTKKTRRRSGTRIAGPVITAASFAASLRAKKK